MRSRSIGWALSWVTSASHVLGRPALIPHHEPHLGAVASESSLCSNVGIDMLRWGGNAADALVGTVLCIGTVAMYHSGIGGGGFMLVRAANGSYEFIDFRETGPAAAFEEMYDNNTDASEYGGLASGVPGELRGLEYLHNNYGKLPWKTVVRPAIDIARGGFPVTEDLVKYMNSATSGKSDFLVENPTWALDFAPDGHRVKLGDILTRKRYADTLETIAEKGADAFYEGPIAEATIRSLQEANGTMTLEDLKDYTVAIREPSQIDYRGYKLTSCSAPSSGAVGLSILQIVQGYTDFFDDDSVNISTHRLDEAMRFAYGQRAHLGDPHFVSGMDEYQKQMTSQATAAEVRSKINDFHTLNVSAYDPDGLESLDTPGTSHIVTADRSGLSISLTTTVNLLFGSQVMVPETGVIMNDEMNDFSLPGSSNAFGYVPSEANYIRPGKRPLSSITPIIIESENGRFYVAIGAAGGSRIITSTVQGVINLLDRGMDPAAALLEPRLHDQLQPNTVVLEYAFDNGTAAFLRDRGHNVTYIGPGQSSVQAVRLLGNGTFEAAAEPRLKNSGGFAV